MKVQAVQSKILYEFIKDQRNILPSVAFWERSNIRCEVQEIPICSDEMHGETDKWIPISTGPDVSSETSTFQAGLLVLKYVSSCSLC